MPLATSDIRRNGNSNPRFTKHDLTRSERAARRIEEREAFRGFISDDEAALLATEWEAGQEAK